MSGATHPAAPASWGPGGDETDSGEFYNQIGQITRQLHDALTQLGVMPSLQEAASGLPDARSRLGYIATKTGEAANKVLNSVDLAKAEHGRIAQAARAIAARLAAGPAGDASPGSLIELVGDTQSAIGRLDRHLTDIMLAQDFHDLTGQVVERVVALAIDLEDNLVKLLVQASPSSQPRRVEGPALCGPVVGSMRRGDVVSDQGEVDDLLASLGF